MSVTRGRLHQRTLPWLHPLHAVLLASIVPLFLGAMLSDVAYSVSYEIQWNNFASWLIVGGLFSGAFALLWAAIDLIRAERDGGPPLVYLLLLLVTWAAGLINALVHAKDAWASMPTGLVLSVVVVVLACAATWAGFSSFRAGGAQ